MKKFAVMVCVIAFVIGIAGCAWGGVSLSAFPDPVFREYLKGYDSGWAEYDSNGNVIRDASGNIIYFGKDNGILDDKEIEGITHIDLSNRGIKSLKGIEHLTALTELYCYDNQLTALDVSNNTALTGLACSKNQLTTLDVSNNTALTGLACWDNQLTTLDLSKNTALTTLTCYGNQLTELDVSSNTALTSLSCGSNQLTALNLSNNTALTWLECDSNQLTELDLSNNTALMNLLCWYQKRSGLKVKRTSEGYSKSTLRIMSLTLRISMPTQYHLSQSLTAKRPGFSLSASRLQRCATTT